MTSTVRPGSTPNSAFASDPGAASDSSLMSPIVTGLAGEQLSFRNNYEMEPGFDGGVLEIAIAGGAFQDILAAGGSFGSGGYTGVLAAGSTLSGRPTWTGSSNCYITTVVNLPPAATGQSLQFRWRIATDSSGGATGWGSTMCNSSANPPAALQPIVRNIYFATVSRGRNPHEIA